LREHGIEDFDLDRHVYLGGPLLESQYLFWRPGDASFDCQLCHTIIWTGEITDEQVLSAQLHDPGLRAFLAGGRTVEQRAEITRRYLRGELTDALLLVSAKRDRHRPAAPRPAVAATRDARGVAFAAAFICCHLLPRSTSAFSPYFACASSKPPASAMIARPMQCARIVSVFATASITLATRSASTPSE
jgi:hypothetical protein